MKKTRPLWKKKKAGHKIYSSVMYYIMCTSKSHYLWTTTKAWNWKNWREREEERKKNINFPIIEYKIRSYYGIYLNIIILHNAVPIKHIIMEIRFSQTISHYELNIFTHTHNSNNNSNSNINEPQTIYWLIWKFQASWGFSFFSVRSKIRSKHTV